MISASHNPYMDNGVKFFSATGIKLEDRLEEEIEARIRHVDAGTPATGEAIERPTLYEDGAEHYLAFLKQTFRFATPVELRIGLDCANGAASVVAPALFGQLCSKLHVWRAARMESILTSNAGRFILRFCSRKCLRKSSM